MNQVLQDALDIRYTKIKFTLVMQEACILSEHKASAIRGGIGEMLLRANCIRDRKCNNCDFVRECIVQRVMYSKYDIQPEFVSSGDSIGYIISCETKKRHFEKGETLSFFLTLFGKNIVYFHQYVNAIYALGTRGLGNENARFMISRITNNRGEEIMDGQNIYMNRYLVENVKDYVDTRLMSFENHDSCYAVKFTAPLSVKYQGEYLSELNSEAFYKAILRRIYMMDCFEGIAKKVDIRKVFSQSSIDVLDQKWEMVHVPRYSNRKQEKIIFHGIKGNTVIQISEDDLPIVLAGELLQIGKNTSFGFGRYIIE